VIERQIRDALANGPLSIKDAQTVKGADRAAVGIAFGKLVKGGLISVKNGQVTIVDNPGWSAYGESQ
jgi:hypothetical protein